MKLVKLQFEIKYNHLLDFSSRYKQIVQPFINMEGVEFTINNQNQADEFITIQYKNLSFLLDVRWDRMFIRLEGEQTNIKNSTSPIKYFFEIYEKLKGINTFKVKLAIIAAWYVKPIDDEFENIVTNFEKKFLTDKLSKLTKNAKDYSIEINSSIDKNIDAVIQFGPFSKLDIKKHNLSTINSTNELLLEDKVGEMLYVQLNQKEDTTSMTKFRAGIEEVEKIAEIIFS